MVIHILGRKDDLKKMQHLSNEIKKICTETMCPAEIKLTHNFSEIPGQSFNAASTPIIFINQQVEFEGMPDLKILKNKIIQIRNMS
jgi:Thioredoxin domain